MELRLIILSAACLSCLVAPSQGTLLATAAAVKGAVLLGAGALVGKGLLLAKGALAVRGLLDAKHDYVINALASGTAPKEANLIAAKSAALRNVLHLKNVLLAPKHKPVFVAQKPCVPPPAPITVVKPLPPPFIAQKMSAFLDAMKAVVQAKSNVVNGALTALKDKINSPVVYKYEIVKPPSPPSVYYAPVYQEPLEPLMPAFRAPRIQYIEQIDAKKK